MPNDDEIVEAMARGIRDIAWGDGSEPLNAHDDAEDLARSALAAQRAMGLVLVPVEPTKAMLQAASAAMSPGKRPTYRFVSNSQKHAIRYRAMIAAAQGGE